MIDTHKRRNLLDMLEICRGPRLSSKSVVVPLRQALTLTLSGLLWGGVVSSYCASIR